MEQRLSFFFAQSSRLLRGETDGGWEERRKGRKGRQGQKLEARGEFRAARSLHLCRFGAFENPQCKGEPHARVLDPTQGGLASTGQTFGPRGYSIGSSKVSPVTYTAEVLCA